MMMTNAGVPIEHAKTKWLSNHALLFDFLRRMEGKVPDPAVEFTDLGLTFLWSQTGVGSVRLWQGKKQDDEPQVVFGLIRVDMDLDEWVPDPDVDMVAEDINLIIFAR